MKAGANVKVQNKVSISLLSDVALVTFHFQLALKMATF
jgi:hypothetical protein